MNELTTIKNVRGYSNGNGVAYLNLEDVARGLGFTQQQNKSGKVYESIRWERISRYFNEFGFPPQVGEDVFIPENIFYKLCFKASNETARKFQDVVTDEILPAIRQTGSYSSHSLLSPELQALRQMVDVMAKTQLEQLEIKRRVSENAEKVEAAQSALSVMRETFMQRDEDWRKWAKAIFDSAVESSGTGDFQAMRRETYAVLESRAHCNLSRRLENTRKRMAEAGATKSRINKTTKLDVIESDYRLKEIYTAILKELALRYSV